MGNFGELLLASIVFIVPHCALSTHSIRAYLVKKITLFGFIALYSIVAIATLYWMIVAFVDAPYVSQWQQGTPFARHLALSLMPFVFILLIGGFTSRKPMARACKQAAQGQSIGNSLPGIIKITRHPAMWAVALWAALHIIARGDIAAMIFFGSLIVMSGFSAWNLDDKKKKIWGDGWGAVMAETSSAPFIAILQGRARLQVKEIGLLPVSLGLLLYSLVVFAHGPVIGISLLPQG